MQGHVIFWLIQEWQETENCEVGVTFSGIMLIPNFVKINQLVQMLKDCKHTV